MAGIVGIVSRRPREDCRARLARMVAALEPKQGDNSGSNSFDDVFIHVGWTSRRGEFADGMPFENDAGDVALFLTGEMFDDPQPGSALNDTGSRRPQHNAGYLVPLYETMGNRFFASRNGLFSGILLDLRRKTAFLFNDRYGMKRLFVREREDELFFASGARALLAVLPETREFDPAGIAEYFTCGCTTGSQSIYKHIDVLPPGSCWSLENGGVKRKSVYFDRREWECRERLDRGEFEERVIETLPGVVGRYASVGLPRGVSLTGGLDSRMLVACMNMGPGEFPCYTFGSMYRESFDVRRAREVARACGQSHTVLILDRGFLDDFPRHMEEAVLRSDGYLGLSGAAELYVNSKARGIAPVRLTGNYGSEVFRGVRAFKSSMPRGGLFTEDFGSYLMDAQLAFENLSLMSPLSFTLFVQAPHQGYGRLAIEESQVIMRTPFLDLGLVQLMYQRPHGFSEGAELSASVVRRFGRELARIPTDRGSLGQETRLERWASRLYHEVLFKGEYWSSHGMPQWVAELTHRAPMLSPEKLLLGRHKFQHFARWLRVELSAYVRDVMRSSERLPCYFDRRGLERMVDDHLAGKRNYQDEIDKVLTVIVIAERFFRRAGAAEEPGCPRA